MCGRYTLRKPTQLKDEFGVAAVPQDLAPRYNICPGQDVPVVLEDDGRELAMVRWGLIPFWAKDPAIGNKLINARGESVADKPSFRQAYRKRRCLIPADGFYEWQGKRPPKTPMHIRFSSGALFALAGLWESWRAPDGEMVRTCTIITTTPNALLEPIHSRMPVILPPEAYAAWLGEEAVAADALSALLAPFPPEGMEAFDVSRLVNSPANDSPACVEPV